MDERGTPLRIRATGILSRALQHEIDHLDGVLFIDRASSSSPSSTAASAK
jgi:peptide deformylase